MEESEELQKDIERIRRYRDKLQEETLILSSDLDNKRVDLSFLERRIESIKSLLSQSDKEFLSITQKISKSKKEFEDSIEDRLQQLEYNEEKSKKVLESLLEQKKILEAQSNDLKTKETHLLTSLKDAEVALREAKEYRDRHRILEEDIRELKRISSIDRKNAEAFLEEVLADKDRQKKLLNDIIKEREGFSRSRNEIANERRMLEEESSRIKKESIILEDKQRSLRVSFEEARKKGII